LPEWLQKYYSLRRPATIGGAVGFKKQKILWRSINAKVRLLMRQVDQKLHRRICSFVELFCLPTAWSENEKRIQNAVRLKNVRTGFL
jgi:hypothetical protein